MSTDKTLADVQPGGRVRLGDQALNTSEGARRYVAYFFATQLRRHDFGDYILTELAGDFACALAQHLSAQPSPGGQGDDLAVELLATELERDGNHPAADSIRRGGTTYGMKLLHAALRAITAALAARQPVVEPVGSEFAISRTMEDAEAASDGMLPAALAPVADEWYRLCERRFAVDRICISGKLAEAIVEAVCVAPPAQAVDLGQFREPIAAWSKHCAHGIKGYESYQDSDLPDWMAERRQQVRKCGELLALIDSQAVGK